MDTRQFLEWMKANDFPRNRLGKLSRARRQLASGMSTEQVLKLLSKQVSNDTREYVARFCQLWTKTYSSGSQSKVIEIGRTVDGFTIRAIGEFSERHIQVLSRVIDELNGC
jgi:phosphoribosyl-AMP cyclohydrolase